MARLAAFLRAVNVGGTGKLPMADLRTLARKEGLRTVSTHLASGNLLFETDLPKQDVTYRLETALHAAMGKETRVFLRDISELQGVLHAIPFAGATGAQVGILIGDRPAVPGDLTDVRHRVDETLAIAAGHIVIHFPSGMGQSRLRIGAMDTGTMRNRNTLEAIVEKLARP